MGFVLAGMYGLMYHTNLSGKELSAGAMAVGRHGLHFEYFMKRKKAQHFLFIACTRCAYRSPDGGGPPVVIGVAVALSGAGLTVQITGESFGGAFMEKSVWSTPSATRREKEEDG